MHKAVGEDPDYLVEDVADKLQGKVLARAENVVLDAPMGGDGQLAVETAQLRIAVYRRLHVPGHVYLGNDRDMPLVAVRDKLFELRLRVKPSVRADAEVGMAAARPELCEQGIFFYLHAPALIFGEMEMKDVELMHEHEVDELFHLVKRHEISAHVQHESAVRKARLVLDERAGKQSPAGDVKLAQAFKGVGIARRVARGNAYRAVAYVEQITLAGKRVVQGDVYL